VSIGFDDAARLVTAARDPADLFGDPTDPAGAARAARAYRRLARAVHPDAVDAARRETATRVFAHLSGLWRRRQTGDAMGRHRLGPLAYRGDIANLYRCGDGYLKVPRRPADNDLLEREARALRTIAGDGDPRFLPYVPRLVDSFRHHDPATGAERQVNVVAAAPGLRSLVEVRQAYPDGLDPRDGAWMWRRLLVALGLAHRAGVIHGAVLPEHVLVQPDEHGLVLVDWCHSAIGPAERIPALVTARREWYPAEVIAKAAPGPGTDIAMATRCMTYLMGPRIPDALRAFAAGCMAAALRQRPDDAWRLLAELDEALRRLYGARTFRPFTL
jgi:hypothetical protein